MRTSSTVIRMLWPVSGGKETGTSTTEPATGLSATVGRVTVDALPLSVGDGQPGRDRVLAVGHDLEIQMVEGDRRGQDVLEPLTGLVRGTETRLPQGGRARRPGWRWLRPAGRRAAGRASRPRCRCGPTRVGPTSRSIMSSGISGEMRAEPVRRRSVPSGARRLRASDGLGVGPGRGARAAEPGHDQAQPIVDGRRPGRPEQVLGHGDGLVGRDAGDAPPRRTRPSCASRPGTVGSDTATPATVMRRVVKVRDGKGDHLPGRSQRGGTQRRGERVAAVEGQGDLGDGAVGDRRSGVGRG